MESDKIKEVWRDVPGYEGYYQVSDLGRVRSLDRTITYSNGRKQFYKGRIISGYVNNGYKRASLSIEGISMNYSFSQLVAMAFLGHKPDGYTFVVDHINGDRSDDRVENLRIVTNRANTATCFRADRGSLSSKFVGVSWYEKTSKWQAHIMFNGKLTYLGLFTDESKASNAYNSALSKVKDHTFNPDDYKPKFASVYKGVTFHKASRKWQARPAISGKQKHLGLFKTELEAHNACQKAFQSV